MAPRPRGRRSEARPMDERDALEAFHAPLSTRIGFIGLGNIGRPMARRLLWAGYDLTVHNRSQGVVEALARLGASPAGSPREVVEACDVVLTVLPFPISVEEVYFG